jgi:hypothetical protein
MLFETYSSCREYNPARRRRVSDAFVHNVPCAIANGKSKSRDAIITLWTSCSLSPILDMLYSSLRLYRLDVTYLELLSLFTRSSPSQQSRDCLSLCEPYPNVNSSNSASSTKLVLEVEQRINSYECKFECQTDRGSE